jgi:hypothetical protein
MKHSRSFLLPSFLLFSLSFTTATAQVTSADVKAAPNYDSFAPPAAGGTYVDPVFGSTIKRVTNAPATPNADRGGNLTWIENEYSTMSAFNNDNSKFILVHTSYFGLYDGSGTHLRDLPLEINASSEPRWSRTDLDTLYYHFGNQLKSYNTATGTTTVVHTFSEYSSISGNGEMDISLDGDHFVLAGDNRFIFVYQMSTDKKFGTLDAGGHGFDSMYITPDNHATVTWLTAGTNRFTGIELFDINMNFLRQVAHAGGHMDVTRDTNGDEVLVWTNSNDAQPIANCNNGIVKIRLADASQKCLAQLDWSLAVHISAPDGNGTVFVDTEAPSNPVPNGSGWVAYTDEILQVKLDGSGVTRLAHHRSRPTSSYVWQPKLSTSRDGSRLLYASNFDMQAIAGSPGDYADTYMIVLGATVVPPAPPTTPVQPPTTPVQPPTTPVQPPTTTQPGPVHFEQDDPSVAYSGTWFPNRGGFNSGGSAELAMDAGSEAKFTFTGTSVKWIGYRDAWSGIAKVYIDGVLKTTLNTYSPNDQAQATEYYVGNLTNAQHTLTIVATGQHDEHSAGSWIWVDAFDITH